MFYLLICLFASFSLCAQSGSVSTLTSPIATSGTAIFPYDPSSRGLDIYNMISTLSTDVNQYNLNSGQVLLLTTRNGLIPFVTIKNVIPTTNYTILIVGSAKSNAYTVASLTFYILPVEQIVEVIYLPPSRSFSGTSNFNASVTAGVLPVFPITLANRTADIIQALSIIRTNTNPKSTSIANYFRYTNTSTFAFQTSLSGPYPLAVPNGVINNVRCVSLSPPSSPCASVGSGNSTLMFITYNTVGATNATNPYYVIASPDQIYGITYNP